jgi:N-acyl-D-amino-acid deacylase
MQDGGIAKLLERLADPKARERAIKDCLVGGERWGSASGSTGFDEILIASCSKRELEGITLAELARRTGREPAHAMMDLVLSEHATVAMISFSQSEENVANATAYAHSMIGSDSLSLHAGRAPIAACRIPELRNLPARAGPLRARAAALLLGDGGAEDDGHARGQARLQNRGLLRPGFAADLALFDPATVQDEATFPAPHRHPTGIPYVIVNGWVVVDGPRFHAVPAGRVLTP